MNLLIDRQVLALALRHAAQAVGAVAPLDNVTLEATVEGLVLSVSDGRTGIRTTLDADVTAPGRCTTHVAGLRKALRATVAYSLVRLEIAQDGLRVWAGSVDIRLPRSESAEALVVINAPVAILPSDPRATLRRVCATIEEMDGRHHLDFVLLEPGGIVACDGAGLVQENLPELDLGKPMGIPRAAALALASVPDRLAAAGLTIGSAENGTAVAAIGRVQVTFQVADAQRFPAWRDILPDAVGAAATVDRAALLAAVRKCALFDADVTLVSEGTSEVLTLHAAAQGRDIREEVPATGTFRRCHIDGRIFAEMLAVTAGRTVILLSQGPGVPVTWHTGYGRAALMPLRAD
jgi:hypothetical protein